ncbi:MAG: TetR/AcrR family transcriptional regulator [Fimbriimonadaceae bacterium]|nr:TetR/AcrR family transcriptional regulator [Chitinophagales bacterium]
MAKLSKEDWVQKGFKLLEKEGYHAIKLENICDKFHVTRGSFYHHFGSMNEYVQEILKYWKDHTIAAFQEILKDCKTPVEKRTRMIEFVFGLSAKAELSVRAWALSNKVVRKYVDYMDKERVRITAEIYYELGLQKELSAELAVFAHSNYIGIQTYYIQNPGNKAKTIQLLSTLVSLYLSQGK